MITVLVKDIPDTVLKETFVLFFQRVQPAI